MYCKHCGKTNENESKFCNNCGAMVHQSSHVDPEIIDATFTESELDSTSPIDEKSITKEVGALSFFEIKTPFFKTIFIIFNVLMYFNTAFTLFNTPLVNASHWMLIFMFGVALLYHMFIAVYFVAVLKLKKIAIKMTLAFFAIYILSSVSLLSSDFTLDFFLLVVVYLILIPSFITYSIFKNRSLFTNKFKSPLINLAIYSVCIVISVAISQLNSRPSYTGAVVNEQPSENQISSEEEIHEYIGDGMYIIKQDALQLIGVNANFVSYEKQKYSEFWDIILEDDYSSIVYLMSDKYIEYTNYVDASHNKIEYSCYISSSESTCGESVFESLLEIYEFLIEFAPDN